MDVGVGGAMDVGVGRAMDGDARWATGGIFATEDSIAVTTSVTTSFGRAIISNPVSAASITARVGEVAVGVVAVRIDEVDVEEDGVAMVVVEGSERVSISDSKRLCFGSRSI